MITLSINRKDEPIETFDVRTLDLSGCSTSEQIFQIFKNSLEFDEGFGNNWNAFRDSILNLYFTVAKGLRLIITHSEAIFRLSSIEQEYIISDLSDMVSGKATQDDGNTIDVCIQMEFESEARALEFKNEMLSRVKNEDLVISLN